MRRLSKFGWKLPETPALYGAEVLSPWLGRGCFTIARGFLQKGFWPVNKPTESEVRTSSCFHTLNGALENLGGTTRSQTRSERQQSHKQCAHVFGIPPHLMLPVAIMFAPVFSTVFGAHTRKHLSGMLMVQDGVERTMIWLCFFCFKIPIIKFRGSTSLSYPLRIATPLAFKQTCLVRWFPNIPLDDNSCVETAWNEWQLWIHIKTS